MSTREIYAHRIACFEEELSRPRIRMRVLRELAMGGIPDKGSIRATTWKVGKAKRAAIVVAKNK